MTLNIRALNLAEVLLITPVVVADARGWFFEAWHAERYAALGLPRTFVQDNVSRSNRNTLRGLHLQEPFGQAKLIQVLDGEIYDVAVDVRTGSPTYGKWAGARLNAATPTQMFVPAGFAHGFCVLSEAAVIAYKCTEYYHPDAELTIAWNDPAIGIEWPVADPVLSEKDRKAPLLADTPAARLPRWVP